MGPPGFFLSRLALSNHAAAVATTLNTNDVLRAVRAALAEDVGSGDAHPASLPDGGPRTGIRRASPCPTLAFRPAEGVQRGFVRIRDNLVR